ncbi:MAG: protein kinase, partial [Planctomycetota bacterium]
MKTLGPYRVLGELGRGGMGVVYRAQDTRDGRAVALKVPLGLDAEGLLRLRREAEAVQGLEHPHLVRVLELSLGPPQPYVAFELVDGETLERRVERAGPLPWPEAVAVASQLASALSAVHARGLLHRDVKPENVLLGPEGAKLVDFGLVKDLDGETLTATGSTLGTPSYMAPEQVGAERERWSEATDVYGLTATLYFALTGLPPFTGATTITILHAVLRAPPPRPGATVPEVPAWLDAVCARGMAKQGVERYPSAIALRAALQEEARGAQEPRRVGRVAAALVLVGALALVSGVGVARALRADPPSAAAEAPRQPDAPPAPLVAEVPPPEVATPLAPDEVVARVEGWLAQQDYAAAERLLTEQLPVQPAQAWVYRLRARVFLERGAKDAAERDAQEGVRLAPEDFAQWTLLAAVHNEQGRLEDAQSELQRGWVLAPAARRAEISMAEGQALCDLRRYAEALEVYDRAQREGVPPATVEVPRAVCLAQLGRLEDAQRALELALEDEVPLGRVDRVWRSLGGGPEQRLVFSRALATHGYAEEALASLNSVLSLRPEDALARKARAELRAKQNDLRGALEDYARALVVDPSDAEAWRGRAQ